MLRRTDIKIFSVTLCLCMLFSGCTGGQKGTVFTTLPPKTTVPETTQSPPAETTEATEVTQPEPMPLVLEAPMEDAQTTVAETLTFQGTADPRYPLEINGISVQPEEDGSFVYDAPLSVGDNVVTLTYLEETHTFTAVRRYTTAWYAYPDGAVCRDGQSIYAQIFAREGSKVTICFNGEKKEVEPSVNQLSSGAPEGFQNYTVRFDTNGQEGGETDLGVIEYTVICGGITEVYTSGSIVCQEPVALKWPDPDVTPQSGKYKDVGSGYIVEIIDPNAETFNGDTLDDKSNPMMNYLPKGTVDYGSHQAYYNEKADRHYYLLRCGVRVYRSGENKPYGKAYIVDTYKGYLPDHNEIGVDSIAVDGHFTQLTLNCLWKAPFFFNEEPQAYRTEEYKRYILDEYNPSYIDITFCYASVFAGDITIPEDNPLFSGAELIWNEDDCTLRLYLKKIGGFYGWNAFYNEKDQLCFRFLNPVTVTPADNAYGADLSGVKIMIDVGHGGDDPGAWYTDSNRKGWREAERNLVLSHMLREELESIGATVVMNRTTLEDTVTRIERISYLLEEEPDFCICIHHNAETTYKMRGFECWYFTSFSLNAAKCIDEANLESGVYTRSNLAWYYYYVSRQTVCPIVLAENGYMSNKKDMDRIANEEDMRTKAQAIARGIVNFYLQDNGLLASE